jgi:hypothetical protein
MRRKKAKKASRKGKSIGWLRGLSDRLRGFLARRGWRGAGGRKSGRSKRRGTSRSIPAGARGRRRTPAADRARRRLVMVCGLMLAVVAVFHVWTGLRGLELGYRRSRAIELQQRLELDREELADALESLLRTESLELEAERRLGLGAPRAGQVVDLRPESFARLDPETLQ